MDPMAVPRAAFEAMVVDALDALPDWTAPILSEIAVLVEDHPREGEAPPDGLLLGLFRGVPRTQYGGHPAGMLPDTITLYRVPIVLVCERLEDVPGRVFTVLGHEVGHAMGLGEARLRELGWH
jgi:predicted Zn-dependent protease with MMP-like domain